VSTPPGGALGSATITGTGPDDGPTAPITLTLTYERTGAPTLIARAFCHPAVSTAWWGYYVTGGDKQLARGAIRVDSAPADPLDGIADVTRDLLDQMRAADVTG
jgi:hypothetical protein